MMKITTRLTSKFKRIKESIKENLASAPTEIESKKIDILRQELKEIINNEVLATDFWAKKRLELYNIVITKDPRNFTNWPVMYPMFFNPNIIEFESLTKESNWKEIEQRLIEDKIGNPAPYKEYKKSSGNLIHHMYSLIQFTKKTNKNIAAMNTIIEFGGGYGSFCRLCYKNNFKGTYIIYDLPEYSAFQNYFLMSLNLNIKIIRNKIIDEPGTICLINDIKLIENNIKADLFIALWSLSECPIELRNSFSSQINKCESFLIGFQEKFENIDNLNYFSNTFHENKKFEITPINHMPNNYYLFK